VLLLVGLAFADGFTLTPVVGVVSPQRFEPGLRLGWEPDPRLALEAIGSYYAVDDISGGLGLTGRTWFAGVPGQGLYLQGRVAVGLHGDWVDAELNPWGGLYGGFGARPRPAIGIEANLGPEYGYGIPAFRSELALTVVFGAGDGAGSGSKRHRPRPVP